MIYYIVAHAPLFQTKNVPIQSLSPRSDFKIPPRGALKSVQQSWWAESPRSELAPSASPSVARFQSARRSPNDYLNGYQKHLRSNPHGSEEFFQHEVKIVWTEQKNPETFQKKQHLPTLPSPNEQFESIPKAWPQCFGDFVEITSNCCFKVVLMIMIYEIIIPT